MVKEGITSFKCFLAYKGALMIDDGALFRILQKAKAAGALVIAFAAAGILLVSQQFSGPDATTTVADEAAEKPGLAACASRRRFTHHGF